MPSFAAIEEPAPGIRRPISPTHGKPYSHEQHSPIVSRYWAAYRHPTDDDIQRMVRIRSAAVQMMDVVGQCTRACADQTTAMRKIREAIHAAEDAILLDKRIKRQTEGLPGC